MKFDPTGRNIEETGNLLYIAGAAPVSPVVTTDGILTVDDDEAESMSKQLAIEEGLMVGITSGMNAFAARELAKMPENESKLIVPLFADTGQRYLSVKGLYDVF